MENIKVGNNNLIAENKTLFKMNETLEADNKKLGNEVIGSNHLITKQLEENVKLKSDRDKYKGIVDKLKNFLDGREQDEYQKTKESITELES